MGLKLQSHTALFRLIIIGVEENLGVKVRSGEDPQAIFAIVNTVERATTRVIAVLLVKSVGNVAKIITSRLFANPQTREIAANTGPKQKGKRNSTR